MKNTNAKKSTNVASTKGKANATTKRNRTRKANAKANEVKISPKERSKRSSKPSTPKYLKAGVTGKQLTAMRKQAKKDTDALRFSFAEALKAYKKCANQVITKYHVRKSDLNEDNLCKWLTPTEKKRHLKHIEKYGERRYSTHLIDCLVNRFAKSKFDMYTLPKAK